MLAVEASMRSGKPMEPSTTLSLLLVAFLPAREPRGPLGALAGGLAFSVAW